MTAEELIDEAVRGSSPHVDLQNLKFELERDFKSSLQKANRGRLDKKQVDVLKVAFSVMVENAFEEWIENAK